MKQIAAAPPPLGHAHSWTVGLGGTWKGARLRFDQPDNVEQDKEIEFFPPPPPLAPRHEINAKQYKAMEDRIKLSETDPFERGLMLDGLKARWFGFVPKATHLPVRIPLPENLSIEEVEDIQRQLGKAVCKAVGWG